MFLNSLAHRRRQPELMDAVGLDAQMHVQALRGLARINVMSTSDRILWQPIEALSRANPGQTLRILDIATGGGDVPLRLWHRARRVGVPIALSGADASQLAVDHARAQGQRIGASIEFFRHDVLRDELPGGFDVLTCSLFLHHLDEREAVDLLTKMSRAARRLVLINDLRRGRIAYLVAWLGTRLLSRSPVVHSDGPVSVEGAFTPLEALSLAERAGLKGAVVEPRWPWRFLITWRCPK